jgi:hypothetical protein
MELSRWAVQYDTPIIALAPRWQSVDRIGYDAIAVDNWDPVLSLASFARCLSRQTSPTLQCSNRGDEREYACLVDQQMCCSFVRRSSCQVDGVPERSSNDTSTHAPLPCRACKREVACIILVGPMKQADLRHPRFVPIPQVRMVHRSAAWSTQRSSRQGPHVRRPWPARLRVPQSAPCCTPTSLLLPARYLCRCKTFGPRRRSLWLAVVDAGRPHT